MTDQPNTGSARPDPDESSSPPPPPPPPPLAPLVNQQAGWAATPAGDQPMPAGDQPMPPGEQPVPPPAAPPAPEKPPSRLRAILPIVVIGAILAVVLYAVRDNLSADDLAIGQCFDVPTQTEEISTVTKHECTEPHDAEVFHIAEYTGGDGSYPISMSFESFVDSTCIPVFATYVGRTFEEAQEYNVGWFYPNRDGWNDGDRTVTCYIVNTDESKLTQSVKVGP